MAQEPICDQESGDLVFVIDSDGSSLSMHFPSNNKYVFLKFIASIIDQLPVSHDKFHVGVVLVKSRAEHLYLLNDNQNKLNVIAAVLGANYSRSSSNIADGK